MYYIFFLLSYYFLSIIPTLLVSLAHLVARMGWAHAKGPKGTSPYPPNHAPSVSPNKSHGLEPCLKKKIKI